MGDDVESILFSENGSDEESTQSTQYEEYEDAIDKMYEDNGYVNEEEGQFSDTYIGINRLINFQAVKSMVENRCCCCVCKGPIQ